MIVRSQSYSLTSSLWLSDVQNVSSPAGHLKAFDFARPGAHTVPFRSVVDVLQSLEQLCERQVGKGGADRVERRNGGVLQDFDRLSLVGTLPGRQSRSWDSTRRFGRHAAEVARLGDVQKVGNDLNERRTLSFRPPSRFKQSEYSPRLAAQRGMQVALKGPGERWAPPSFASVLFAGPEQSAG